MTCFSDQNWLPPLTAGVARTAITHKIGLGSMKVNRTDLDKFADRLSEFYSCLTKDSYQSRIPATRQAYALECVRPGRQYAVYQCWYCGFYHVGRKSARRAEI